jgi:hypothetical protein
MSDFDTLVRLLRRWTHSHDPHVRAAVELLIEHETWIRRGDFQRACVERDGREAWINWRQAREFVDSGSVAYTSEMAVLDLAVAIGESQPRALAGIPVAGHRSSATTHASCTASSAASRSPVSRHRAATAAHQFRRMS